MIPFVGSVIFGFEETLRFQIVKKTVVDHDLQESSKVPVPLYFEGNLQPLHPKELLVKPEGQRKWKWYTLFTDMRLEVDTVLIAEDGIKYRVMASSDWGPVGYTSYQLIEGPGV